MELRNKIEQLERDRFNANQWLKESVDDKSSEVASIKSKMQYGRLYKFNYFDPKSTDRLKFYNTNPLVIKIDEIQTKAEGIIDVGINLNFFPVNIKYQIVDLYRQRYNTLYNDSLKNRFSLPKEQKQVKLNTDNILRIFDAYGIKFGIRRYIFNRISNLSVFSNDLDTWSKAMLIKYPRFNGIGVSDRDKLFAEYINKTK